MIFQFFLRKCKTPVWSIGIYRNRCLLDSGMFDKNLLNNFINPVLTAKDVTDFTAEFVADPFILKEKSKWYMFFEVLCKYDDKGYIGLATSELGYVWKYEKIILDESFHLSYPYVFKYSNEHYMIPECGQSGFIKLYKADKFPEEWSCIANLIEGDFGDASIFEYDEKLWIISEKKTKSGERNINLHLYYSTNLFGEWIEHPKSPIVKNNIHMARPAGRVIVDKEKIFRFAQDDGPYYGKRIRMFEITKLTINDYEENEIKINLNGTKNKNEWNADGMHHIDIHKLDENEWLACVDGHFFREKTYLCLILKKITMRFFKYIFKMKKVIQR